MASFAGGLAQGLETGLQLQAARERQRQQQAQFAEQLRLRRQQQELQARQLKMQEEAFQRQLKENEQRQKFQEEFLDQLFGGQGQQQGAPSPTPSAAPAQPGPSASQLSQLGFMAEQAGMGPAFRAQLQAGLFETPAQRVELTSKRLANTKAARELQANNEITELLRQRAAANPNDQALGSAFLMARSGNIERALEIAAPNIREAKNFYQDLRNQGKSPVEAARIVESIQAKPTKATLAMDAARGDKLAKTALDLMKRDDQEIISIDPQTGEVIISKGKATALTPQQTGKKMQEIQNGFMTLSLVRDTAEIVRNNPTAAGVIGSVQGMALNFGALLTGITAKGNAASSAMELIRNRAQDINDIQSARTVLGAMMAQATGLVGNQMTDSDLKRGIEMVDQGGWLRSPSSLMNGLRFIQKTTIARMESNKSILGPLGTDINIPQFDPEGFRFTSPKAAAPQVPKDISTMTDEELAEEIRRLTGGN